MKIWLATQENDYDCYNIVEKTKKDLIARIDYINSMRDDCDKFTEAFQIDVDCSDVFQLICDLTDEAGGRHRYMGEVLSHFLINKDGKLVRIPIESEVNGTDLTVYRTRTIRGDDYSRVEKDVWNLKTKQWKTERD